MSKTLFLSERESQEKCNTKLANIQVWRQPDKQNVLCSYDSEENVKMTCMKSHKEGQIVWRPFSSLFFSFCDVNAAQRDQTQKVIILAIAESIPNFAHLVKYLESKKLPNEWGLCGRQFYNTSVPFQSTRVPCFILSPISHEKLKEIVISSSVLVRIRPLFKYYSRVV